MMTKNIISLLDLTRLNANDTTTDIDNLCLKAVTPYGETAAVCVHLSFVKQAKERLQNTSVRIATVANFPQGTAPLSETLSEIQQAIKDGADEIDIVMPYHDFMTGKQGSVKDYLKACRAVWPNKTLKIILETGALMGEELIARASQLVVDIGADFIKTSTGKIPTGATLEAATTILSVIKQNAGRIGIKLSGGVRTVEQALSYLSLIENAMGAHWITSHKVRIGASQLLDEILNNP